MFHYTISKEWNADLFFEVCSIIESHFKGIVKGEPFYDFLDGDIRQEYFINEKKILVNNDSQIDALYVDSEIDLNDIIKSIF